MYTPTSSSYQYVWGAYFSSCYNQGTLSHNGQPALQSKTCTDLLTGYGGHRKGLCQMGAAYMAKSDATYSQIALYYFSNCSIVSCPTIDIS